MNLLKERKNCFVKHSKWQKSLLGNGRSLTDNHNEPMNLGRNTFYFYTSMFRSYSPKFSALQKHNKSLFLSHGTHTQSGITKKAISRGSDIFPFSQGRQTQFEQHLCTLNCNKKITIVKSAATQSEATTENWPRQLQILQVLMGRLRC